MMLHSHTPSVRNLGTRIDGEMLCLMQIYHSMSRWPLLGVSTVLKPCTQVSTTQCTAVTPCDPQEGFGHILSLSFNWLLHMTETGEGTESVADIVARVKQGKQAKRTAKPNAKGSGTNSASGNGRLSKSAGATVAKASGGSGPRTSLRGPAAGAVSKVSATATPKRNVSFSKGRILF